MGRSDRRSRRREEGTAYRLADQLGGTDVVQGLLDLGWSVEQIRKIENPSTAKSLVAGRSGPQSAVGMNLLGTTPSGDRTSRDVRQSDYADIDYARGDVAPYTPPPPPPPAPPAPVDSVEYDPDAPDILEQMYNRYTEGLDPLAKKQIGEATRYATQLSGLASDYGDTLRGSEGYGDFANYRDENMGIYEAGGLTDVTKAALEASRRDEDQWVRAQREAMLQDLAERGMSGGGAEIAGAIGDRAAAANRMSARDLEANAFAQQQALEALERSYGASDKLFGIDKQIADTQLGYDTQGEDTIHSIAEGMTDMGIDAWTKIYGDFMKQRAQAWQTGREGTVGAGGRVVETLDDGTSEGQDRVEEEIDTDVETLNKEGALLTGTVGTAPPPLTTITPPLQGPTGAGTAGEAGAAAGGAVIGSLIDNFTIGDDDEEDK